MAGKVGFIGLGAMGGPMALNLAKAGFELVVHDIDAAQDRAAGGQGRRGRRTRPRRWRPQSSARSCIVETTEQAEEVIIGEHGIIQRRQARPHRALHVRPSIRSPRAASPSSLAAQGIAMLDAPVSGGTGRAQSGELSVIVGGDGGRVRQVRGPVPGDGQPHLPCRRRWAAGSR